MAQLSNRAATEVTFTTQIPLHYRQTRGELGDRGSHGKAPLASRGNR